MENDKLEKEYFFYAYANEYDPRHPNSVKCEFIKAVSLQDALKKIKKEYIGRRSWTILIFRDANACFKKEKPLIKGYTREKHVALRRVTSVFT